MNMLPV